MIVRCSDCKTRYLVDPTALGEAGRRVRCTRCGHMWRQTPGANEPAASDSATPPVPLDRPPAWAGWAAAGLFVIAALAGLALARNAIVTSWPGTVSIYDAVGLPIQAPQTQGLRIVDVSSERVKNGDRTILLVRGACREHHGERPPAAGTAREACRRGGRCAAPVAGGGARGRSGRRTIDTLRELARRPAGGGGEGFGRLRRR